ncbi:MAG: glycosyltransferase family 39 protein, partial [Alphaproteobacteria bacterium]|nr:glycosyltransferase family 39 protein [Alphaproteobacteria bacterium]
MERRLRFGTALSFFVLAGLTILVGLLFFHPPRPSADALRYIDYAVNLHLHGAFGLSKGVLSTAAAPGNQNTPLYPAWIAAMMTLDPGLRESLLCIVQDRTQRAACPMHFGWFVSAQLLFASITVFAVWLLARRLTRSLLIAWIAAGFAILAEAPYGYANQFLTEAVLLPLFSLFILFLVLAYQDRKPAWLLAAGLTLGLATLTRPGYEYLFYAVAIVLAVLAIRFRTKTAAASVVLFAVAFAVTVAPWMLRNKQHFDSLALTSKYGGAILAQRIAFNRMSWPEVATAFVHWFPDFGQKISGALIAPRHYRKLTMGPAGYYQKDGPEVMREAHANAGGPDAVVP